MRNWNEDNWFNVLILRLKHDMLPLPVFFVSSFFLTEKEKIFHFSHPRQDVLSFLMRNWNELMNFRM